MDKLKTRFAPSPTGLLHVGQTRTALFSYALARKTGGEFLLRIEDTDRERHIEEAIPRILSDLRWLGIDWDEGVDKGGPNGPYRQSERLDTYKEYVGRLLKEGKAYYAFETAQELDALRAVAETQKRAFRYTRPAVLPTEADAQRARAEGRPVVVRLLCPQGDVTIRDDAFGEVTMPADQMDDFVLLKADGWPTYHAANVIDDALMGVNYIVRGQEFLGQTWRHVLLRRAWGFPEPVGYCHLPLILNTDNSKMSKRDKHKAVREAVRKLLKSGAWTMDKLAVFASCDAATAEAWLEGADAKLDFTQIRQLATHANVTVPEIDVFDFRQSGYLPEALINFVALLGWSPGKDLEKFSLPEFVQLFGPDRIGKTNARFDRAKLLAFNTDAIAASSPERRFAAFKDYLSVNETPIPIGDDDLLRRLLAANPTLRTFADIPAKCGVLFVPDDAFEYDAKAVDKVLLKNDREGMLVLEALCPRLAQVEWAETPIQAMLDAFAAEKALGMGKVAQPIRVAVSGTTVSPNIHDTLILLGREKSLARIDRCLKLAK